MTVARRSFEIKTPGKVSVVNITGQVRAVLEGASVREGLAVVSVPHTTCGLCVNEDEQGLRDDLVRMGTSLLEPLERSGPFRHDCIDDNARAHLTAVLLGHSVTLPVSGGDLVVGTWQSVFLLELDGPRSRRVDVFLLGD